MIPCQPPPHLVQLRSPPTLPEAESSAPEQKFSSQPRGFTRSAAQRFRLLCNSEPAAVSSHQAAPGLCELSTMLK